MTDPTDPRLQDLYAGIQALLVGQSLGNVVNALASSLAVAIIQSAGVSTPAEAATCARRMGDSIADQVIMDWSTYRPQVEAARAKQRGRLS